MSTIPLCHLQDDLGTVVFSQETIIDSLLVKRQVNHPFLIMFGICQNHYKSVAILSHGMFLEMESLFNAPMKSSKLLAEVLLSAYTTSDSNKKIRFYYCCNH